MSDKLITEKFQGGILLKSSIYMPDGRQYWGFTGIVSILEGKGALGFEVKDDSNWFARIESTAGQTSLNFPGCQVRGILQGDYEPDGDLWMAVV